MPDHRDPEISRLLELLPAETSSRAFWQELRRRADPPRIERHGQPRPIRRATLIAAIVGCCAASLAAGTALGATILSDKSKTNAAPPASTTTGSQPNSISFTVATGWNTFESSIAIGSDRRQWNAWSTNGPVASDDSTNGWPNNTLKAMQSDQVVVWAALNTTVDNPSAYPKRELPLALSDGEFKPNQYGGQPAANVSEIGPIYAQVGDEYVTAYVWFGSNKPTATDREAANEELQRLAITPSAQSS
jgi:hypothetical protein